MRSSAQRDRCARCSAAKNSVSATKSRSETCSARWRLSSDIMRVQATLCEVLLPVLTSKGLRQHASEGKHPCATAPSAGAYGVQAASADALLTASMELGHTPPMQPSSAASHCLSTPKGLPASAPAVWHSQAGRPPIVRIALHDSEALETADGDPICCIVDAIVQITLQTLAG